MGCAESQNVKAPGRIWRLGTDHQSRGRSTPPKHPDVEAASRGASMFLVICSSNNTTTLNHITTIKHAISSSIYCILHTPTEVTINDDLVARAVPTGQGPV